MENLIKTHENEASQDGNLTDVVMKELRAEDSSDESDIPKTPSIRKKIISIERNTKNDSENDVQKTILNELSKSNLDDSHLTEIDSQDSDADDLVRESKKEIISKLGKSPSSINTVQ